MKKKFLVISVLLILSVLPSTPVSSKIVIDPSEVSISGSVKDNYVNMSYTLFYQGAESSDTELSLDFYLPEDLFLSNITVVSGGQTYYGRVLKIREAVSTYNSAVKSNKSAVLITATGRDPDSYKLEINLKAGEALKISIFVEGFLLRKQGAYKLGFISFPDLSSNKFSVDLDLISTRNQYNSPRLFGLIPSTISIIADGYHISYTNSNYDMMTKPSITYIMTQSKESSLIGYNNGEEQFFVYQFAPEIQLVEEQVKKEYIYVIDSSGSMGGPRITNAKSAFTEIIQTLNEGDKFNVISFSTSSNLLWESTQIATPQNVETAMEFVNNLSANGGTNLNQAMLDALGQIKSDDSYVKAVTILSDGIPSSGEQDTQAIRNNVRSSNNVDAMVFSVSLGSDSDETLMTGLALDGRGRYVQIDDDEEVEAELLSFYSDFSVPLATGYTVNFDTGYDLSPSLDLLAGALFNGSEILISGKFDSQLTAVSSVHYIAKNDTYSTKLTDISTDASYIERIWAINTIDRILDFELAQNDRYDQMTDLALKYGIVVQGYTAIVLVVDTAKLTQTEAATAPAVENTVTAADMSWGHSFLLMTLVMVLQPVIRRRVH